MALPEQSDKYSDRQAFRSFNEEGSVLGGQKALLIYSSLRCCGVGGSVDRIAGLCVIIRFSCCSCVYTGIVSGVLATAVGIKKSLKVMGLGKLSFN